MDKVPLSLECSDEAAVLLMCFQLGLKSGVSVHTALYYHLWEVSEATQRNMNGVVCCCFFPPTLIVLRAA